MAQAHVGPLVAMQLPKTGRERKRNSSIFLNFLVELDEKINTTVMSL